MNKLSILIISACLSVVSTANALSSNKPICPDNAPLFTTGLGTQLINNWGANVAFYSPTGKGGFTDVFTGAAEFVGNQYLSNGVLIPTVSPITRDGVQNIYNYFTQFLSHSPQMINNPPHSGGPYLTLAGCGYGVISGFYNFTFLDGNPPVNARYTFQFEYIANAETVSIKIENGPQIGQTVNITKNPGWYVMLQNSAALPANLGIPVKLLAYS